MSADSYKLPGFRHEHHQFPAQRPVTTTLHHPICTNTIQSQSRPLPRRQPGNPELSVRIVELREYIVCSTTRIISPPADKHTGTHYPLSQNTPLRSSTRSTPPKPPYSDLTYGPHPACLPVGFPFANIYQGERCTHK